MFSAFFAIVAVLIVGVIVAMVVVIARNAAKLGRQNRLNRASPLSQSLATVVDKREEVSGSSSRYGGQTSTTYYATFELPSGQRLELAVSGPTSGQLVVGDTGQLTWQGTWFRGFGRQSLR